VIAIIAILASMLLPALQAVKQQAQSTSCISNLKQCVLTAQMYADDHKGIWGSANGMSEDRNWLNQLILSGYLKGTWNEHLKPGSRMTRCPSIPYSKVNLTLPQGYASIYNNGSSYDPNWGIPIYDNSYKTGHKYTTGILSASTLVSSSVSPAFRIWFSDGASSQGFAGNRFSNGYASAPDYYSRLYPLHRGQANIGTIGGSVSSVPKTRFGEFYGAFTYNVGGIWHYSMKIKGYAIGSDNSYIYGELPD